MDLAISSPFTLGEVQVHEKVAWLSCIWDGGSCWVPLKPWSQPTVPELKPNVGRSPETKAAMQQLAEAAKLHQRDFHELVPGTGADWPTVLVARGNVHPFGSAEPVAQRLVIWLLPEGFTPAITASLQDFITSTKPYPKSAFRTPDDTKLGIARFDQSGVQGGDWWKLLWDQCGR